MEKDRRVRGLQMAGLTDDFGRDLNYVRISVTDRCNYRCRYCMPPGGVEYLDHSEIMRYEEISFLCSVLRELGVGRSALPAESPLYARARKLLKELNRSTPILSGAHNERIAAGECGRAASKPAFPEYQPDTLDPVKLPK